MIVTNNLYHMPQKYMFMLAAWMILSFGLHSCGEANGISEEKVKSSVFTEVDAYVLRPSTIDNKIYANGSILANEEVELRNEIPGRIVRLNFEEGQKIAKGQVLLQIDAAEFDAQLRSLESKLNIAEKDEARKKELLGISGVSQEIYDNSAALVEELKAEIQLTKSRVRNSQIEAPFSGRIGLRYVSPGAYLGMGERIAVLVQDDPVKIEFSVPQRYASMISKGQSITFRHSGSREEFEAEVYATEPRIDIGSRTLKVRARCSNKDGQLIPGSFVDIEIILERIEGALMVSTDVIIPQIQGQQVMVAKKGIARAAEIETGTRTETMVQIIDGVAAGDTIITTALLSLKDGSAIQVRSITND